MNKEIKYASSEAALDLICLVSFFLEGISPHWFQLMHENFCVFPSVRAKSILYSFRFLRLLIWIYMLFEEY